MKAVKIHDCRCVMKCLLEVVNFNYEEQSEVVELQTISTKKSIGIPYLDLIRGVRQKSENHLSDIFFKFHEEWLATSGRYFW